MMFHQPAQRLSSERAIGNDAGIAGPVADFPGLADGLPGGQGLLIKAFEVAPAPDPFFEDGLEGEWIKHDRTAALQAAVGCFSTKRPCARNLA